MQKQSEPRVSNLLKKLDDMYAELKSDETQIRRQYEYFRPLGRQFIVIADH